MNELDVAADQIVDLLLSTRLPIIVRQVEEGCKEFSGLPEIQLEEDIHARGEELSLPQSARQ